MSAPLFVALVAVALLVLMCGVLLVLLWMGAVNPDSWHGERRRDRWAVAGIIVLAPPIAIACFAAFGRVLL